MSMNRICNYVLAATLAAGICVPGTVATALPAQTSDATANLILVSNSCYAVGQSVAKQNGGKLAAAKQRQSGGQAVCVVVVLIPAKDGQRPKRQQFIVPQ